MLKRHQNARLRETWITLKNRASVSSLGLHIRKNFILHGKKIFLTHGDQPSCGSYVYLISKFPIQ